MAERRTQLAGRDDRVLDMYAGGMTVRDIAAWRTRHCSVGDASESDSVSHG